MVFLARLELEPALAGRVRERLHPAVVPVARAVEGDGGDALLLRAPRDLRADGLRARDRAALGLAERALLRQVERRRGAERHALRVVHDLHVDLLQRAVHGQARTIRRARQAPADPAPAPVAHQLLLDEVLHGLYAPVAPAEANALPALRW